MIRLDYNTIQLYLQLLVILGLDIFIQSKLFNFIEN